MRELTESLTEITVSHKLVIFDLNGVLDQQTGAKRQLLSNYLGQSNPIDTDRVLVTIERLYEQDKSISLSQAIEQAVRYHQLPIRQEDADRMAQNYLDSNRLDPVLWQKVSAIATTKPVAIYTSLKIADLPSQISSVIESHQPKIRVFDGSYFKERKPSIDNLIHICESLNVSPREAVMIGDNVAVDLMPAKLLGMSTILVSDYVDSLTYRSIN